MSDHKLTPREPTDAMAIASYYPDVPRATRCEIWRTMHDAAPAPAAPADVVELIERLRRASKVIFLAAEELAAESIYALMTEAADALAAKWGAQALSGPTREEFRQLRGDYAKLGADLERTRADAKRYRAAVHEFVIALEESAGPTIVGSTCRLIRAESALCELDAAHAKEKP